jgi:pilus assembly protein CpaC
MTINGRVASCAADGVAAGIAGLTAQGWPAFLRQLAMLVALVAVLAAIAAPASAQEVSGASDKPAIDIAVGQGRLLRFTQPVESVLIADTTIADLQIVSPQMVYVFGLKPGLTNLIAITADQKVEATTEFRVSADPRPARQAQRVLQPRTATDLTIFGDRIVATGHAGSVGEALDTDNIARAYSPPDKPPINDTTVSGSQQVNIRVRFAEISRSELLSFGVDWNVFVTSGNFSFGLLKTGGLSDGGNLGLGVRSNSVNVNALIEALQRNGIVKILAEPNLTAVTGQTASFLAGGEIPVPVPQGRDTVTVEYKPFGVSLGFTPTLITNNRIALHVQPEVSSISDSGSVSVNGFNLPSFVVRRADTTVEVASGQTFAIAGLFQQKFARNLQKFPFLGDVPVLGTLFQSQRFQREETELVILITPYLVKPVSSHDLATPLDRPARKKAVRKQRRDASMGLIVK